MKSFDLDFRNVSLKKKLTAIIMATTLLALVVAFSAFISYDISEIKHAKVRDVTSIARMIGHSCVAALEFSDAEDATEVLASLKTQADIEDAIIYFMDGRKLAAYVSPACNDPESECEPDSVLFTDHAEYTDRDVQLFVRIENNGIPVGMVYLKVDLHEIQSRTHAFIIIAIFFGLVSMFLAYVLAARMQSVISTPILNLAATTRNVRESRDFSIRAAAAGKDETGTLVEGFNEMLSEIQQRDSELQMAHNELELRADQLLAELTERFRAESDAAAMKAFLQNVLDSMPSVVIAVNKAGRVTQWNAEAERVALIPRSAATDMIINDAIPALHLDMDVVHEAIQSGRPEKWERIALKFVDEERIYDIILCPLTMAGTEGAVLRVDDVTERVRMEEMMIQTEKMMSVGGLAAGMAHEINNPLGIIVQSAQNMLRRVSPDLRKNVEAAEKSGINLSAVNGYLQDRGIFEFLNDINDAGKRAAIIVSNMLNFSRRTESEHNPVDVGQLLRQSVELAANDYDLKKKYDFRHIEIIWELDPQLPPLPCVETKIEQVLLNLLKNAAQAIGIHGCSGTSPRINIRTAFRDGFAEIQIADNGPGMDESVRRRVFEPFFTTKEVGTGTGLGLSVSYFIITDNHHGTIECESTPGIGTTFTICLPLSPSSQLVNPSTENNNPLS